MTKEHEELVERARRYFPSPSNPVMEVDTHLLIEMVATIEELSSRNEFLETTVDTLISVLGRVLDRLEEEDSQETKLEGTE